MAHENQLIDGHIWREVSILAKTGLRATPTTRDTTHVASPRLLHDRQLDPLTEAAAAASYEPQIAAN